MVWCGNAWIGKARLGWARRGRGRLGEVWYGSARRGLARQGFNKEERVTVYNVEIQGISPLLMHRWAEASEINSDGGTRKIHISEVDPRTQAEQVAYRHPDGWLYMPGAAIARMLCEAGGSHKQKGSRKSLKFVVPAACLVLEDAIPLLNAVGSERLTDFEVDSRPIVIPSTKGRIMRHRPRINAWRMEFSLDVDVSLIDQSTVHTLLSEGGKQLGIGDYRPEKRGPFGRFQVVRWEELLESQPVPEPVSKIARPRRVA